MEKDLCYLNLYYNGSNCLLFVDATKIYQFTAKYFEIKPNILSLCNISKGCKVDNMKKIVLKRVVKGFSDDYNAIDTNNINERNMI